VQLRRPQLSLKGRALRLLGGREHSRSELERKLASHEEEPGQLRRVLDELEAKGFIDHQRVADSVVHRRAAKLGAMRVRQELQAKGLDAELVSQTVAALKHTELERARAVWRRKFEVPAADAAARGKQARFLAARGFDGEVIRRVLAGGSRHSRGGGNPRLPMDAKQPAVYILASQPNGTLYVGVTSNLVQRIWQHRVHLVDGFTKEYGVTQLVWYELQADMERAIEREKRLKKWERRWKLHLVNEFNPDWRDLWAEIIGSLGSPPSRG
jgi:regulatory protein